MKPKKGGLGGMLQATANDAKKKDAYSTTLKEEDPPKKKTPKSTGVKGKTGVKEKTDVEKLPSTMTFKQKKQALKQGIRLKNIESKGKETRAEKKARRLAAMKIAGSVAGGLVSSSSAYSQIKKNIKD